MWRECSCGLSYMVAEAGATDYEPMDGYFSVTPCERLTWVPGQTDSDHPDPLKYAEHDPGRDDGKERLVESLQSDADEYCRWEKEELYFRRIVSVFDPIFNFVYRNMFCRCILGVTSLASTAPRMDFLTTAICPNHTPRKRQPDIEAMKMTPDYNKDPYFDKYGGYQAFLSVAHDWHHQTLAEALVNVERLQPTPHFMTKTDEDPTGSPSEAQYYAWEEYRAETLDELQKLWDIDMSRNDCDKVLKQRGDVWFASRRSLLKAHYTKQEEDYTKGPPAGIPSEQKMTLVLRQGRVFFNTTSHSENEDTGIECRA